jgi:SAM-dependent methyltransferase
LLDWYEPYYRAIRTSRANALFCERVYGRDLGQHGFMDDAQMEALLSALSLRQEELALDLGCGDGRISLALSEASGARLVGVDNAGAALESSTLRDDTGRSWPAFVGMDIGQLGFASGAFDAAIAVDSLYFTPLDETIGEIARVLSPGGRLAAFYSRRLPDDKGRGSESLRAEGSPLAVALCAAGFWYEAQDFAAAAYLHMVRRKAVLVELADAFAEEGNQFIYDNRLAEAEDISRAIEAGAYSRHLFLARRRV